MTVDYDVTIHYRLRSRPARRMSWRLYTDTGGDSGNQLRSIEITLERRRVTFNGHGGEAYKLMAVGGKKG
jgi:hypothetical protein